MDDLIRRRFRIASRVLLLVVLSTSGCKDNACEDRPPEAQIDVRLIALSRDAYEIDVRLSVNEAEPLVRTFAARSQRFVFGFGELNRAPRKLRIEVRVLDSSGNILSTDSLSTTFLSNGCNFFSIDVDHPPRDAGMDTNDFGRPDFGPPLDLDAPDTAIDAAIDAADVGDHGLDFTGDLDTPDFEATDLRVDRDVDGS